LLKPVTLSGVPDEMVGDYMVTKFASFRGGYFNFDLLHYSVWVDFSISTLLFAIVCGVFLNSGMVAAFACMIVAIGTVKLYYNVGEAVGGTIATMTSMVSAKKKR
jgi:hypothetical protein